MTNDNDSGRRQGSWLKTITSWFNGNKPTEQKDGTIDFAEEFSKLQRSLRRLNLANDRNTELLGGLGQGFQDLNQTLLKWGGSKGETRLSEKQLLDCLDRLDRAFDGGTSSEAAADSLNAVHAILLEAAGWRAVAVVGGNPNGVHMRVVETLSNAGSDAVSQADGFRIHTILQQGYLRADGSRVRSAVVVAAGSATLSESVPSTARHGEADVQTSVHAPE